MAKSEIGSGTRSDLEDLLDLAAGASPVPSEALLARVLADADAALALRRATPAVVKVDGSGLFSRIAAALGGWPALAGLASATIVGIWFGYTQPAGIDGVAAGLFSSDASFDLGDLMPEYDIVLAGG